MVEDFINLADLAPTILNAAGADRPDSFQGRSFWGILTSVKEGWVSCDREFTVTAFERHIICPQDGVEYPMRSIRTKKFRYIQNYEPSRCPAGDPDFVSSHQGLFGDCDKGVPRTISCPTK